MAAIDEETSQWEKSTSKHLVLTNKLSTFLNSLQSVLHFGRVLGGDGVGWEVECTGHLSKQGNYFHISSAIYIDIDMSVN